VKRIIVTGGTGFIGRYALPALAARGFEIHAFSRQRTFEPTTFRCVYHSVDLMDADATKSLIANITPTHLLHLAWDVEPGKYWSSMNNLSWVSASLNLFQGFHAAGGRRAVFAGTCAEYDWSHTQLSEALTPLRPRGLYGHAKNALHEIIEAASAVDGLRTAWGRIFFLYGPGEPRARLVSDAFYALLSGEVMKTTLGTQERDFMHVADVGGAFAALADSEATGSVNIASGRCVPVRNILEIIGRLTGRSDLLALGARSASPDEPPRLVADITRLTDEIKFAARYTLDEGLLETLTWWRSQMKPD
jgi:nucleoside-diphosphate-sugar epimerase